MFAKTQGRRRRVTYPSQCLAEKFPRWRYPLCRLNPWFGFHNIGIFRANMIIYNQWSSRKDTTIIRKNWPMLCNALWKHFRLEQQNDVQFTWATIHFIGFFLAVYHSCPVCLIREYVYDTYIFLNGNPNVFFLAAHLSCLICLLSLRQPSCYADSTLLRTIHLLIIVLIISSLWIL